MSIFKLLGDELDHIKQGNMDIIHILHKMESGRKRRELIKQWFSEEQDRKILVNCRRARQTKRDSDLKRLLKEGFLKMEKVRRFSCHHSTYLVKA